MSAYTAYQLAQPQQSLLDRMTTRGFGTAVDTTAKKKGIMDEAQEKIEKAFKRSEKRSEKWKPVTTILDTAQGFVTPETAAILGAISGTLSGYDRKRAYEGLEGDTKNIGKYKFMDDYTKGVKKQVRGLETDSGDVLVSAGTGALKGFLTATAGEAASKGIDKAANVATDVVTDTATKSVEELAKDASQKLVEETTQQGTKQLTEQGTKQLTEQGAKQLTEQRAKDLTSELVFKADASDVFGKGGIDTSSLGKLGDFDVSKIKDVSTKAGGFKPEWADWIKNIQKRGGKDFLSNLIDPEDITGSLARITQAGQGILEPLLAYNKPSDFRLLTF